MSDIYANKVPWGAVAQTMGVGDGEDYVPKIGNRMGFIETISDTLSIYRQAIKSELVQNAPFANTMLMRETVDHIKNGDLYHMDDDFNEILKDYGDQFDNVEFKEMRFSEFTRPPSKKCYVRISQVESYLGDEDIKNVGFITEYFEDQMTSVRVVAPLKPPMPIGAYHPTKGIFWPNYDGDNFDDWSEHKIQFHTNAILSIAGAFELINNPRFVLSQAAGTRAQRRQMKREQNIPVEVWHKITWNVDETTVVANDNDRGGWHMPLHYTRGHFRKAEPHWENAVCRKDGNYYKWIEGFWSGHPAFGIKKGYHAPKIGKVA
jgi:hypothetical protein